MWASKLPYLFFEHLLLPNGLSLVAFPINPLTNLLTKLKILEGEYSLFGPSKEGLTKKLPTMTAYEHIYILIEDVSPEGVRLCVL